jgi:hypothetical protein
MAMAKSRYVPNPKRTALKTYLNAPQARLRAEAASQIKKQIEAGTYQVSTKLWEWEAVGLLLSDVSYLSVSAGFP